MGERDFLFQETAEEISSSMPILRLPVDYNK